VDLELARRPVVPAERQDLYPGQTILVAADCGGYDPKRGWDPNTEMADAAQDSENLSQAKWKTIAVHGQETGELAHRIASAVAPDLAGLFDLAGR